MHSSVRFIQDTSETDFSSLATLKGSGPLSSKNRRGAFLHTHLLVAPGGLPIGIHGHEFIVRKDEEHGKAIHSKQRPIEEKESYRWIEGYRKACLMQNELPDTEVVSVGDREADIYELFVEHQNMKKAAKKVAHYVVRAKEDRVLLGDHENETLFELDQKGEPLGVIEFEVPAQRQRYKEKGNTRIYERRKRLVKQELRVHNISPRPPHRPGKKLPQVSLYLVSATEVGTPADQHPINWRLLTSKEVDSFEKAREVLEIYLDRWQIEVFFKVLKSGCKIEELGLKEMEGLQRGITMLSLVAWRLLYATHLAREEPDLPCGRIFKRHEWEGTLRVISPGKAGYEEPNIKEFIIDVAKLGGYLNRKHDPAPGPEVLWRGMLKVESYGEAWLAFSQQG